MQIKYSESLSSLQSTVCDCYDFLAAAGCLRPITSLRDKDMLVNDLLIHHVIKRIISPLERFVLFVNFQAPFTFSLKLVYVTKTKFHKYVNIFHLNE